MSRRAGGLCALALAVGSVALVLAATRSGPAVTPDSTSYLAAATAAADGQGFVDFDGSHLSHWPAGYPAVLATFGAVGLDLVDAARFLNAALMGVVVLAGYALCVRHTRSIRSALFGTVLIACSPALLRTHDAVLSEPLFSVVVLAFILVLEAAVERRPLVMLACAGALAGCGVLVRYLGVALIAAGVLTVAVTTVGTARPGRSARAAWFAGWSLLPVAVWVVRNVTLGEPPMGRQPDGAGAPATVARELTEGLGRFLVPQELPAAVTLVAGLGIVALVVVTVVVALRSPELRSIAPTLSVVVSGLAVTFVSGVIASSDVSARILAPFFVPLLVSTLWLWTTLTAHRDPTRTSRAFVTVCAVVAVIGFVAWAAVLVRDHGDDPDGFAAQRWSGSELVRAVEALPDRARVYSNDPEAVWYLAGRRPVGLFAEPPVSDATWRHVPTPAALEAESCRRPVRVAWFGAGVPDVGARVERHADGALLEVEGRCS